MEEIILPNYLYFLTEKEVKKITEIVNSKPSFVRVMKRPGTCGQDFAIRRFLKSVGVNAFIATDSSMIEI